MLLNKLQFAAIQVVGNTWQDVPIVLDSTHSVTKLESSSINSYDNQKTYVPPPGITITKDDLGNTVKESSLRLNFTNILPGDAAYVRDILIGQSLNISSYQTVSMWIHGDNQNYGKDLRFFFRFGSDDSTYYEYSAPMDSGWFPMNIDLHALSKYKQSLSSDSGGKIPNSITNITNFGQYAFGLKYHNGAAPSFSNITWMAIGIIRSSSGTAVGKTGEFWVDELKVSGVHQFNGWAGRASLSTSWAGFMNLAGSINYNDGNFQQMTDTKMQLGTSALSENYSANWALGRFFTHAMGGQYSHRNVGQRQFAGRRSCPIPTNT